MHYLLRLYILIWFIEYSDYLEFVFFFLWTVSSILLFAILIFIINENSFILLIIFLWSSNCDIGKESTTTSRDPLCP